jgi:hypothetical protein
VNDLHQLMHIIAAVTALGDRWEPNYLVEVEMTPYDLTKGRITYRLK